MIERGSASVVTLGFIAAAIIVAGVLMGYTHQVYLSVALQGATDRAALAGADAHVGVIPGMPCVVAGALLVREGFTLASCEIETSSVRVVGQVQLGGLWLTKRAHAGVVDGGEH
jgi:secretion/DNA translocation related TadE-like protein